MKIGLDGFAVPHRKLDARQMLEFAREQGLAGVFFSSPLALSADLDGGQLREVKSYADQLGLYVELGAGFANPRVFAKSSAIQTLGDGDYRAGFERVIRAGAAIGCRELLGTLGGEAARFDADVPWGDQLGATRAFIQSLAPLLRDLGCRLNLETHADITTFELVRLIEDLGAEILGVCLDTANVLLRAEDPIAATRRVAPYVHQTHAKDAILYTVEDGLMRQTRPCGHGIIDWPTLLTILGKHSPDLNLSIEDHKLLFGMRIHDPAWLALHPDLTASELDAVVRLARACDEKIARGEIPEPLAYEATPWADQAFDRLGASIHHLRGALARLDLPPDNRMAGR